MKWLIVMILFLVVVACNKDKYEINLPWLSHCARTQAKDSASIMNQLNGKWKWEKYQCAHDMDGKEADKDIVLDFTLPTDEFILTENGTEVGKSSYSISKIDSVTWRFHANPATPYTHGTLFICGTSMVFHNTPVDGCDHQFNKK